MHVLTVQRENLHSVVAIVAHQEGVVFEDAEARRVFQLAVILSLPPELEEEVTNFIEDLHSVALSVRDVEAAVAKHNAVWGVKMFSTEREQAATIVVKDLNAVVFSVWYYDTAFRVHEYTPRTVELATVVPVTPEFFNSVLGHWLKDHDRGPQLINDYQIAKVVVGNPGRKTKLNGLARDKIFSNLFQEITSSIEQLDSFVSRVGDRYHVAVLPRGDSCRTSEVTWPCALRAKRGSGLKRRENWEGASRNSLAVYLNVDIQFTRVSTKERNVIRTIRFIDDFDIFHVNSQNCRHRIHWNLI